MINLLRRCENCVFSCNNLHNNWITCNPKLPDWVFTQIDYAMHTVDNFEAERCPAFRLRDIGENHNV